MSGRSGPGLFLETLAVTAAAALALAIYNTPLARGNARLHEWLIPASFLYLPLIAALVTDRDFAALGMEGARAKNILTDLAAFLFAVLPLFLVGWWALFHFGLGHEYRFGRPEELFALTVWQFLGVALPEEVFFRGYLQGRLNQLWGARWSLLGIKWGPGLIVAAVLFTLAHLVVSPRPDRLLVFFPGLLFGLMRERENSVIGSFLAHGAANVSFIVLQQFGHPPF